jgi:hypothetical protein
MVDLQDLKRRLHAQPFEPFAVVTTSGDVIEVPRADCGFLTRSYLNILRLPSEGRLIPHGPLRSIEHEQIASIQPLEHRQAG